MVNCRGPTLRLVDKKQVRHQEAAPGASNSNRRLPRGRPPDAQLHQCGRQCDAKRTDADPMYAKIWMSLTEQGSRHHRLRVSERDPRPPSADDALRRPFTWITSARSKGVTQFNGFIDAASGRPSRFTKANANPGASSGSVTAPGR